MQREGSGEQELQVGLLATQVLVDDGVDLTAVSEEYEGPMGQWLGKVRSKLRQSALRQGVGGL